MNDKYVKLADVKRKLRYIFKAYGVGGFAREKVERALNNLPYSVKGNLETTLEAADVQPVKRGRWELTDNPSFRKCSECGAWWSSDITDNCFTKYCPKCGARMIKDSDTNERS